MNPFTRFLNQWSSNRDLEQFIERWDVLERVMVRVHRGKVSLEEAQTLFDEAWPWLRERYPKWEEDLRPYWQQTVSGGQPTTIDPFQLLLDLPSPAAIQDNWHAMQHLPSAREALNQFVRAQ